MTARQVMQASEGFERPLGSLSVARSELLSLVRRGLLRRQEIPRIGPGECERLYFLSRRAGRVAPEVSDLPRRASVTRPLGLAQMDHALGVSEFLSLLHRDCARSQGRARLLRTLGDRELAMRVDASRYGLENRLVVPDATVLLELEGTPQLLFLELMNRGGVIRPGIPASISRSFVAKLWRYKALVKSLDQCSELKRLVGAEQCPMPPGFRVLVVSIRGPEHLEHLRLAANSFRTLCYFARIDELKKDSSMLLDPVWALPQGQVRAIVD